jgi:hypothetical protein
LIGMALTVPAGSSSTLRGAASSISSSEKAAEAAALDPLQTQHKAYGRGSCYWERSAAIVYNNFFATTHSGEALTLTFL